MNIKNHNIQGKMITAKFRYSSYERERIGIDNIDIEDMIKKKLIQQLAEELYHCKMVEFTKQDDYSDNTLTYRARIFATTDEEVRTIRQLMPWTVE